MNYSELLQLVKGWSNLVSNRIIIWRLPLKKVIKAYQKIDLLILDEFLLSPVSSEQTRELLEIIEARSVKGSVIFCTQFEPAG